LVAVENLSLEINSGELFGFVGPNGSNKSTTIKCILNFIKKNSGKVYMSNVEFLETNITEKSNIGYLASEIKLHDDLISKQIIGNAKKI
jgi:ABC-2 type transport system ATP-binding protein